MLNVNSTPKKSSQVSLCNTKPAMCYTNQQKLLDGTAMWHGGFLLVASTMENQTAKAISKAKNGNDCIDSLIFTGHSAGGAIAQIFYAMSMSSNTALSRAVSGESLRNVYYRETTLIGQKGIGEIHCVTFGTPPVASTALHYWERQGQRPGVFLSIIIEGDPVPQAQEEFIKALIDVYVLSNKELDQRYPGGFYVPSGRFRASGNTVILRDIDPDNEKGMDVKTYKTNSERVETKLFGNPFVHLMTEYLERIEQLASLEKSLAYGHTAEYMGDKKA